MPELLVHALRLKALEGGWAALPAVLTLSSGDGRARRGSLKPAEGLVDAALLLPLRSTGASGRANRPPRRDRIPPLKPQDATPAADARSPTDARCVRHLARGPELKSPGESTFPAL